MKTWLIITVMYAVKLKPEKNSALNGIRTHDHLRVHYKPTMWPAPRLFDSLVGRALHWYVQAHIFFRLIFHSCLSCVYNCDDQLCLDIFLRSSNIWYSYIHLHTQLLQGSIPSWGCCNCQFLAMLSGTLLISFSSQTMFKGRCENAQMYWCHVLTHPSYTIYTAIYWQN